MCYFCDDKYTPGNKCNLPKQLFVLDLEYGEKEGSEEIVQKTDSETTTEEWSVTEGDAPMIFLCALNGIQGAQTIHVTSYNNKRPLQILLDEESTHNFIDYETTKRLGCQIAPTKVGYISLGNNSMEATSGVVRNL